MRRTIDRCASGRPVLRLGRRGCPCDAGGARSPPDTVSRPWSSGSTGPDEQGISADLLVEVDHVLDEETYALGVSRWELPDRTVHPEDPGEAGAPRGGLEVHADQGLTALERGRQIGLASIAVEHDEAEDRDVTGPSHGPVRSLVDEGPASGRHLREHAEGAARFDFDRVPVHGGPRYRGGERGVELCEEVVPRVPVECHDWPYRNGRSRARRGDKDESQR